MTGTKANARVLVRKLMVQDIPILVAEPSICDPRPLILAHGFGGSKESNQERLVDLASLGFLAISFDAWQHGDRLEESHDALVARIHSNIRLHFWPILARTTDDFSTIIDWVQAEMGYRRPPYVGGISMGGDAALAAAGLDHRIARVAVALATPDWRRPGTSQETGTPDEVATACLQRCNPIDNLDRYAHCPEISFQCGAEDRIVPAESAQRFAEQLRPHYARCPARLEVMLHPGLGHKFNDALWSACKSWFAR